MWQKCPVCNGSGQSNSLDINNFSNICSVCNGQKIISELTGLPPERKFVVTTSTTYDPIANLEHTIKTKIN